MKARNRELFGLIPAALLMTAGLVAVLVQESNRLSNTGLIYGGVFLGLCVVAHIFIRVTLPHADPYLIPLVSVLACYGLVMILRVYGTTYARQQAQWFVLGLVLLVVTVLVFRDYRKLERYRYLIVIASIVFMALPRVPGLAAPANGAYLAINLGPFNFQPTEFGKIGLIIFLASYLRDHRQALAQGTKLFGIRVGLPPLKHLGPMLLLWGISMLILIFLHDIGTSIMFYGGLLAVLYVATARLSFVVVGVALFAVGAYYLGTHVPHIDSRVQDWLHPFDSKLYYASGGSQQLANAQFDQAAGGLFGQGFGESIITVPGSNPVEYWLPAPGTDMIYAVIVSEVGLFGAVGLLAAYLIICWRGFKAATLARDSFSKLLATGLSTILALQVFVIVGGVTRVIPLTGVTLPFVSYGGSSILANFILVALLLLVSDRSRRQAIGAMTT
jgi:cell division protein FtsW (lipid II flippase)